ncbi:hypothetical protein G4V62_08595 [Bacillaceae bacterium SIJ1]|uniref:replication initiation and membrane attachment family protein n=1 Tax=Litoribacterium kuwaitense TaxID=1398745 RepID=UPI0013EA6E38|nr:DnaD domain protein [Litoribacterium kuwaitense]NGP45013.1 hypothetical protein [Litoribacterium kuwaitense]
MFEIPDLSLEAYETVTRPFNDVFKSVQFSELKSVETPPLTEGKTYEQSNHSTGPEISDDVFDFQLFLSGLSELMIPKEAVTPDVKAAVYKLALAYGIHATEMKKVVMSALTQYDEIDIELLRKQAREWYQFETGETLPHFIHRIQPAPQQEFVEQVPKNEEDRLIQALEQSSPYQLLCDWSGGAKPSEADLRMVEEVMFQQKLTPGVVNVLLYYVMLKSDMKLNRGYVEKIAGHWSRKHISTVREAMTLAKEEHAKYKQWQEEKRQPSAAKKTAIRAEKLPSWANESRSDSPSEPMSEEDELDKVRLEERLKQFASFSQKDTD